MKRVKKLLSLLLTVVMVFSMMPADRTAYAASYQPVGDESALEVEGSGELPAAAGEADAASVEELAAVPAVNEVQDGYSFTTQPTSVFDGANNRFNISWSTSFVPTKVEIGHRYGTDELFTPVVTITSGMAMNMTRALSLGDALYTMYVRAWYGSGVGDYKDSQAFQPGTDQIKFDTQPVCIFDAVNNRFNIRWSTSFVPTKVEIGHRNTSDRSFIAVDTLSSGIEMDMSYQLPLEDAQDKMYVRVWFGSKVADYVTSYGFTASIADLRFVTQPADCTIYPEGILGTLLLKWNTNFIPQKVEIGYLAGTSWVCVDTMASDLSENMTYSLAYDDANTIMRIRAWYNSRNYVECSPFSINIIPRQFTAQPTGGTVYPESTLSLKWKTNFTPTKVEIGYLADGSRWVVKDTLMNNLNSTMQYSLNYDDAIEGEMLVRAYYRTGTSESVSAAFTVSKAAHEFADQPMGGTVIPDGSLTLSWTTNFTPISVEIGILSDNRWSATVTLTAGLYKSMSHSLTYEQLGETIYIRAYYANGEYVQSDPVTVNMVARKFTAQPGGATIYPWRSGELKWTTNFTPVKVEIGFYVDGSTARWIGRDEVTSGLKKSMSCTLDYDTAANAERWHVRAFYGTGTSDYVVSEAFRIEKLDAYVCGDDLTATLDTGTGTLTFSGTGAMYNYTATDHAPWFTERSMIKTARLPAGVTSIGMYAFHLLSNMHTLAFPPSVTQIGSNAVYDCSSLRWVSYDGFRSQWDQINWNYGNARIQNASVSFLVRTGTLNNSDITWGIYGDQNLLEIDGWGEIPGHTQMPWAEYGSYIELVKIWDGITKIGEENFRECSAIKTVYLPGTLTWVDDMAFSDCTRLADVYFDGPISDWNQITIRPYNDPLTDASLHTAAALHYLTDDLAWSVDDAGLLRIFVTDEFMGSGDQTAIPNYTTYTEAPWYADYADVITAVHVERGVTVIGNQAFGHLSNLRGLEIDNTVLRIGNKAFSACRRLEDFTLPDSIITIGSQAFSDCSMLELLHLPDSITMILSGAFAACSNLEKVWLPNSIVGINDSIFLNCGLLDYIEIPATVTEIKANAFSGCDTLTDSGSHVYYGGTSAQWKAVTVGSGNNSLLNAGNLHFTPEELAVNEANFPDAQFRAYVAANFDTDSTGYLTDAERESAGDINDEDNDYSSLQGIEFFPNLTSILLDMALSLESVDLSANTELAYVDFSGDENLAALNLNGLTELRGLYVSGTRLSEIDLSGLTALESLSVSDTPMTALDLSPVMLSDLYCANTGLTALDLGGQSELYRLYCQGTGITSLDLRSTPLLLEVVRDGKRTVKTVNGTTYVQYQLGTTNHILAVDADVELIGLNELPIDEAHFPDADFRAYVSAYCDANGNGWLSADEIEAVTDICMEEDHDLYNVQGIEYFTELTYLVIDSNPHLTSMDLTANTKLVHIEVWNNGLTELNVSGLTKVGVLSCDGNQLRFLDVSGLPLESLYLYGNPMGTLILGSQPGLKRLECYGTGGNLKTLDIRECPLLLDAYQNGEKTVPDWGDAYNGPLGGILQIDAGTEVLTPDCFTVDVIHFPDPVFWNYVAGNLDTNHTQWLTPAEIAEATQIYMEDYAALTSLQGIEYFTELSYLTIGGSPLLTSLDLRANTKLVSVDIWNTGLADVDLTGFAALRELFLSRNALTTLDVSALTLQNLDVQGNPLTSLTLGEQADLAVLYCYGTELTELDLKEAPLLLGAYLHGTVTEETDYISYKTSDAEFLVDKDVRIVTDDPIDGWFFTILGRKPGEEERARYQNLLDTEGAAQVLATLVFSEEVKAMNLCNTCFVQMLHEAVLGVELSEEGTNYLVSLIEIEGKKREEIFNLLVEMEGFETRCSEMGVPKGTVMEVPEYGTIATGPCTKCGAEDNVSVFVRGFYETVLGRDPDAEGFASWRNGLYGRGTTGYDISYGFIFSEELTAKNLCNTHFMEILYRAILGREPDEAGLAGWLEGLQNGMTREEVFQSFLLSTEFEQFCNRAGIRSGTDQMAALPEPGWGTSPKGSCTVCGEECGATKFARRLYNECLGREAEAEGLSYWEIQLWDHYQTGTQAAYNFFFSPEFIGYDFDDAEFVDRLYRTLLGRDPDTEGRAGWISALAGGLTREEAYERFAGSNEFRVLCNRYGIAWR